MPGDTQWMPCCAGGSSVVRFGLIGLGALGRIRQAALERAPGCTLRAVCDTDPTRMQGLSGVQPFETPDALARSDECDAVIVSTPPDSHERLTILALENGKHVMVEKPMAPTAAACLRMMEAAERARRILTVGFNHRYFAAVAAVREAVRSGALGRLSYVKGYAGHVGLAEFAAPWMYDRHTIGGGTLFDNGIHVIDLVRHLMGEVCTVQGAVSSAVWGLDGVEDNGFALLRGRDGVIGSLHSSWSEWRGYRFFVEACGERGLARAYYAPMAATVITMDRPGGLRRVRRRFYPGAIVREKLRGWQSTVIRTFVEEFRDFLALTEGRAPTGPIARAEDGLRAVEIAAAICSSAQLQPSAGGRGAAAAHHGQSKSPYAPGPAA